MQLYADADCTRPVARFPWHYSNKPTRRNRYVTVNCARYALAWAVPVEVEPPRPYYIVEIGNTVSTPGNALGGDKRFLKVGLTREVCGPGPDGGPVLIAACPTQEAAERVKRALENLPPGV